MTRNLKKVSAIVVVFMLLISGMPMNVYGQSTDEIQNTENPYEMMVDTTPDLMTVEEIVESVCPQDVSQAAIDAANIDIQPSDYENVEEVKQLVEDAIEDVNAGETNIEIDQPLLDDILKQQQDLVEQSKTDRFIVKYSETGEDSFKEKVGDEIQQSIEIGSMVPGSDNSPFRVVDSNKMLGDSYEISPDTIDLVNWADEDNKELLILDNPINPSEFAEILKENNIEEDIEYIQPDFQLELQGLEDESPVENIVDSSIPNETDADDQEMIDQETIDEIPSEEQMPEEVTTDESITNEPVEETTTGESISNEPVEVTTDEAIIEDLPEAVQTDKVIVAILDTGLDITHPDLEDYIYVNQNEIPDNGIDDDGNGYIDDVNGWNFPGNSGVVYDESLGLEQAHATHIAGIITGHSSADANLTPNDNISILPLKVFSNGIAYTSDIIAAIDYAERMGAKIVNCSFGSTDDNQALKEAIESSGMLFICSVGNARSDLERKPIYPACFDLDNIVSVTSTNADGGLSYFSNYSPSLVDVAALGRDINSTLPGDQYGLQNGTSMSTALVSGIAAEVLSTGDTMNSTELKERLLDTSDILSNLQDTIADGRQINASNAINNLEQTDIMQNSPASDFDVNGYNPTQAELYQLFSSSQVTKVCAGRDFSLVLKNDGTVWAWGSNSYGQCGNGSISVQTLVQVIGLTNVQSISVGPWYCLALKSDGTVWAWGYNSDGQLGDGTTTSRTTPVQVSGLTGVVSVAAGEEHSLAMKSDGTVWAWGRNNYGQLGDGTTTNRTTPVQVSGLTGVVSVAAGSRDSLAVKSNGTVWSWGWSPNQTTPVQVSGLTDVVSIDAGYYLLAMKSDGTVWSIRGSTPIQVSGLTGVVSVAAGDDHFLAVKSDETVWAWGGNFFGQLGDGTTTERATPVQVSSLTGVVSVAAGHYGSIALKSDGTVWAWGWNSSGQLGDDSLIRKTAVQVSGLTDVASVAAGQNHGFAIKSNGTVWLWGENTFGQLGDGTTTDRATPVNSLTDAVSVAGGDNHSLAAKSDGTVWSCGENLYGQLGDGTTTNRATPVQVSCLTGVVSVAAGRYYSIALKSDGTVWAWARNNYGQLGDGTTTNRTTPVQVSGLTNVVSVAAGHEHSLAVKSDGTVWAWGLNEYGQLGDGTTTNRTTPVQVSGLTSVVSVAGGYKNSLALKSDGTVWTWGANELTPVQVSGLTGVVGINTVHQHNIVVKSDGTVWAWGYNSGGQLGDGTTTNRTTPVQVSGLTNVVSVAAGVNHSLAVKSDGTVWAWGYNTYSQLGLPRLVSSNVPIQCQAYIGQLGFESASYRASVPNSGSNTITVFATGTNSYGNTINTSDVTYSLANAYAGVSINSSTGSITLNSSAQPGSVQVIATYQNLTCSATLNIGKLLFESNSYTATIPTSGLNTITISAIGTYFDGSTVSSSAITYSLASSYTGVSINSSTGAIILNSSTQPGFIQVTATYLDLTNNVTLNIGRLSFECTSYAAKIPTSTFSSITISAIGTDPYGNTIPSSNIYYCCADTCPGVSINSSTGVITVSSNALPGSLKLIATYQNLTCSTTLLLTIDHGSDVTLACTLGQDIYIPFRINKANNLNNIVFSLDYSTVDLDIVDLVSQTKIQETTTGIATGSSIEILTCTPGAFSFRVNKSLPDGKTWSGVINIFKFKSKITGQTTITADYN